MAKAPSGNGLVFQRPLPSIDTQSITAIYNLGPLGSHPVQRKNFSVSHANPTDVFKFSIDGNKTVNLGLDPISGGAIKLRLFRDSNNSGKLDSGDMLVASGSNLTPPVLNGEDQSINRRVSAGTYFARVSHGLDPLLPSIRSYTLNLSATPHSAPSNIVPKELEMGVLQDGIKTFTGHINHSNTSDVYAFSKTGSAPKELTLSLTGLGVSNDVLYGVAPNLNLRLIRDGNNNGLVDTNEVVATSMKLGSRPETITREFFNSVSNGNYLLQVYQVHGSTDYTLKFNYRAILF